MQLPNMENLPNPKALIPLILLLSFLSQVDCGYCRGDHGASPAAAVMMENFIQSVRLFGLINSSIGIFLIGYWKWGMYRMAKPSLEVYERPRLFKNDFGKKGIIIIGLLLLFMGVSAIIFSEHIINLRNYD